MRYLYFIDGVQIEDEPLDWDQFDHSLERVGEDIRGFLDIVDLTITFTGDGYDYIKARADTTGLCRTFEIRIEQIVDDTDSVGNPGVPVDVYEGVIFLPDIEFNLTKKHAKCKIEDNSFNAKINNNKNVKAFIDVGRSKNEVDITGKITTVPVDMFKCNTAPPTYLYSNRDCFRIWDVFNFLVAYMTDDEVGFESDYLLGAALDHDITDIGIIYITTGAELRTGNASEAPNISFKDAFENMNRLLNLGFQITEDATGKPVLKVEQFDELFSSTTAPLITFNNLNDLIEKADRQILYSHIRVGNSKFDDIGCYPNTLRYESFSEEDYNIAGTCNIDKELNLTTKWISDSNIISDVLINNNDAYDDDIFIIVGDATQATAYSISGGNPFHFNEPFLNSEIMPRHIDGLPDNIVKQLANPGGDLFKAVKTVDEIFTLAAVNGANHWFRPVVYDDDSIAGFDDNSNYNEAGHIAMYHYLVPADGNFTFEVNQDITIEDLTNEKIIDVDAYIYHLRGGVALSHIIDEVKQVARFDVALVESTETTAGGDKATVSFNLNKTFAAVTGDRFRVHIRAFTTKQNTPTTPTSTKVILEKNGTFECTGTDAEGGSYKSFDSGLYKAVHHEFDTELSITNFNTIKAAPTRRIGYNCGEDPEERLEGWIETLKFDRLRGTVSVKTRTTS